MDLDRTRLEPRQLFDSLVVRRETPAILDVRNADEFERWRIEGCAPLATLNVPYFEFIDDPDAATERVRADGTDWVAVCAKGDSSAFVAEVLREAGMRAANLEGGMLAWGAMHAPMLVHAESTGRSRLELWQVNRFGKGCLSYVLVAGDEAVAVDPSRQLEVYEALVRERDARLVHVLDTHVHADHLSGGAELAARAGVPFHVLAGDGFTMRKPAQPLSGGSHLRLGGAGGIDIQVLWTPGHTPGSTSFLVDDRWLLTGDTLFVNGIGRPDLGGHLEAWARELYRTLCERLAPVPDDTIVLPAHFGSAGEVSASGAVQVRLGELRARCPEITGQDLDTFVERLRQAMRPAPEVYARIIQANLSDEPVPAERAGEWELGKNQCAASAARPAA